MNLLKQLLTVVAFGYLCYHIYTFGPGKARAEARHAKKHKKQ